MKKIKSDKGIMEVGKRGITKISIQDDNKADVYTAGENIYHVRVKKILDSNNVASNSRISYNKGIY